MTIRINPGTAYERVIGDLDPKRRVFSKQAKLSKHLFKMLDAWGVDAEYFDQVLYPGDYLIQVNELEEMVRYEVPAATMREKGQFYHFKGGQDHRTQLFLPRVEWRMSKLVKKINKTKP